MLYFPAYVIKPLSDIVGRDSVASIEVRYVLEGLRIESRYGQGFPNSSRANPEAHPASCTVGNGAASSGIKRPGRGVDLPPRS